MTMLHPFQSARARHVFLEDPSDLNVVELEPGAHLHVRFVRRVDHGRWRVTGVPSYLVPLRHSTHEFHFLIFAPDGADTELPLRFERAGTALGIARESRRLVVLPLSADDARTPRAASPRTA